MCDVKLRWSDVTSQAMRNTGKNHANMEYAPLTHTSPSRARVYSSVSSMQGVEAWALNHAPAELGRARTVELTCKTMH